MKRVLLIGHYSIRLFLRYKAGYLWLFVVPLVFVYFFGVAFRGPGAPANARPAVRVDNRDEGFLGGVLLQEIEAAGMRVLGATNSAGERAERTIIVPADFTARVLRTEPGRLTFSQTEGSDGDSAFLGELGLIRALLVLNSGLLELGSRGSGGTNGVRESELRALLKEPPPVHLEARFAGQRPIPSGFSQSLPGVLVQFLMMNLLIFGGTSVAGERTTGVLRRLAVYPLRRWELVLGKVYGRFLLGVVQIAFFLLLGQFVFHLGLGLNLVPVVLTLCLYAWVAASLGVWIGAVMKAEDKIVGLCVLATMVMSALGGCWWPMEIVPRPMQVAGHLVPSGWAMDALHQLISFGHGWAAILPQLGVLALFAAAANLAAARTFRY